MANLAYLMVFAVALLAVIGVLVGTLMPALPRIVALLSGNQAAAVAPLSVRAPRRAVV